MIVKLLFHDYEYTITKRYYFHNKNINENIILSYVHRWIKETTGNSFLKEQDNSFYSNCFLKKVIANDDNYLSLHHLTEFHKFCFLDHLLKNNIKLKVDISKNPEELMEYADNLFIYDSSIIIDNKAFDFLELNLKTSFSEWLKKNELGYEVKDEEATFSFDLTRD